MFVNKKIIRPIYKKYLNVMLLKLTWLNVLTTMCLPSYNPDLTSDPFSEDGCIWSFNYFLYNKKLKRIVFFTCRAVK